MCLLRMPRSPLRLLDYPMSTARPATRDPELLAVLKTTALVESRAEAYADYLRAVFVQRGADWRAAIDQWQQEESKHGALLQRMVEATDPAFDFDAAYAAYRDAVPYHDCDGRSVRGSIAAELVARCVVEALASTYYRMLHDAVDGAIARAALSALAQDEARHYGMFRAMLAQEQAGPQRLSRLQLLWVALRRMLELSDQQISGAYAQVRGMPIRRIGLAQHYAAALFPRYRWCHLRYAARLLMPVLGGRRDDRLEWLLAAALWVGVKLKSAAARWIRRLLPLPSVPTIARAFQTIS